MKKRICLIGHAGIGLAVAQIFANKGIEAEVITIDEKKEEEPLQKVAYKIRNIEPLNVDRTLPFPTPKSKYHN